MEATFVPPMIQVPATTGQKFERQSLLHLERVLSILGHFKGALAVQAAAMKRGKLIDEDESGKPN